MSSALLSDAPCGPAPDIGSLNKLELGNGTDEECDLKQAIDQLAHAGWLSASLPSAAGGQGIGTSAEPAAVAATADLLRIIGRSDLAVARLYEGHLNAVKLVELYAEHSLRESVRARIRAGALLGVWGAVGADPLRVQATGDTHWSLAGDKVFTSGLGLVELAVVPVPDPHVADTSRLLLIDVGDVSRQVPDDWRASGMRATRSGRYRFGGLQLPLERVLGRAGVYELEPWFEGGIWRYIAAHVGGMEALVDELVATLRARRRDADPHQSARIGQAAALVLGARALLERVALEVETADPDDSQATGRAVALALLARESVETSAISLLALVERSLGMGAFERGLRIERVRRDLGLYLRQAGPDAKLARAAATVVESGRPIGTWW